MTATLATGTAEANGRLWGARARDWASIQEGQVSAAYLHVLDRTGVTSGTRHLDVGCGAGMAAALSATLGATVAGLDARRRFWRLRGSALRRAISGRATSKTSPSRTTALMS